MNSAASRYFDVNVKILCSSIFGHDAVPCDVQFPSTGFKLQTPAQRCCLRATLPPPLLSLMGIRAGHRFKAEARNGSLVLRVRYVASATSPMGIRKGQGAERVRFERRWAQVVRNLQPGKVGGGREVRRGERVSS